MSNFLKSLLCVSEKAANIARACRSEQDLFQLLVQEKLGNEGNTGRGFADFKTLADVLVQETIKYDLIKEFPDLKIRGEESNTFSNTLNESIIVEVKESRSDMVDLLVKVLDGNESAAELLVTEVYREINFESIKSDNKNIPDDLELDLSNAAIWIDPIDCTSEYIHGVNSTSEGDLHKTGLQCVTVLIGVFDKLTGIPFTGVINQPFYSIKNEIWSGKCYWGVQTDKINVCSQELPSQLSNRIVLSKLESSEVQQKLVKDNAFSLIKPSGAGYKILSVISGEADAYVLSKDSIFNWDTCGPHAILKAMGGSVIKYNDIVTGQKVREVTYEKNYEVESKDISFWKHVDGVIAYRSLETLAKLMNTLTSY